LFGLCGSLTYFQSLKNCWKYFPDKKGLISGIIFSSFGLSAFIFTSLGDYIINPNDDKKSEKGYYSKEISENFLIYIKVFIICIIVMGTISCILCFPFEEESSKENESSENNEINKDLSVTDNGNYENNENHYSVEMKYDTKKEEEENENLTLKESLLSLDFFLCLAVAGCTLIYGFLLTNTYRNFGSIRLKGYETALKYLSKAFTLLNTFSRLVWGFIFDKIGFKILYFIVCINQLICGGLIYLTSTNIVQYFIIVCFGVLSYAGHIILFPNLIHHKFGVDNSVVILGICGIFGGISALIGPILTTNIKDPKDYLMTYLIGVAPTVVSLLITCFIKDEKLQKKKTMPLVDEEDVLMKEGDTNNHKELDLKDKN
jgi:OFA family oxalate/formate antiporter-like MFS transporter